MLNVVRTNALFCDKMETSCQKNVAKRSLYKEKDVSLHPCKLNNMNTNRTSKAFIIRAAITLLVMLLTSVTAWADNGYNYIAADGSERNTYIDDHIQDGNVTVLSGGNKTEFGTNGGSYWYVVTGIDVEYNEWLTFNGNTNLILADGASITIVGDNGIVVYGNLNIYGQSESTGSLNINAKGDYDTDGSGDGIYAENGNIVIVGGAITINAYHNGITTENIGNITITGGKVTANGSKGGIYATGNITLGYTKDTDCIFASSYGVSSGKSISISSGKTMIDGETLYSNALSSSEITKISNMFLAPNLFGIGPNNDGSISKPYIINSPEGLQLLATYVNSGTVCVSSSDHHDIFYVYEDKYFKLNNDIAFNTEIENNFTPIGGKSTYPYYAFCGSFDGDGHTISGINIFDPKKNHAGIFGYIESRASISNITLVNAYIDGNEIIGGIVGENNGGNISNCLVANTKIYGNSYTGAITGLLNQGTLGYNYYGNSTINNATNNVGCGTATNSLDVTTNDGAVKATFLSESEDVPSSLSGKVFFYREFTGGQASTICLPFAYAPRSDDGTFYTFDGITKNEEGNSVTYVATMKKVTSTPLSPNMPYLFVPAGDNTTKPVLFHGTADYDATKLTDTKTPWTFIGTYSRLTYVTSGTGLFSDLVYGFAAKAMGDVEAGEFVRADVGAYIPPMRCFLKYGLQSTRGEIEELPERITVKLVNDPTSIGTINTRTGEVTFDSWYSLDGRRFSSKPTRKGLYINKGIKVMIK